MKTLVLAVLNIVLLLVMPAVAFGQQSLISDPEIYEKKHFQEQCKTAEFADGFVTRQDINNDGLIDAVVNEGQLTCDGQKGPQCNDDGCTYNFYLQVAEGGYFMMPRFSWNGLPRSACFPSSTRSRWNSRPAIIWWRIC